MTLKELLLKLPIEVQEHVRLKVNQELRNTKVIDFLNGSSIRWNGGNSFDVIRGFTPYNPSAWTSEGYYPEKQDIDF